MKPDYFSWFVLGHQKTHWMRLLPFFPLSCLCSIITAGLENKSRDNWFVGLRRSLFSRVIIRQLHYGWRRRNPSLAFTNIYREDVGREGGKMRQCLIPNGPSTIAAHTWHAGKHANPFHNGASLTLPPAVRRRREVSGGAERREVAWTVCSADLRRSRKTDVAVISERPSGDG